MQRLPVRIDLDLDLDLEGEVQAHRPANPPAPADVPAVDDEGLARDLLAGAPGGAGVAVTGAVDLEHDVLPVDHVARAAGFGSTTTFRDRFRRDIGTSPRAHRRAFRGSRAA